LASVSLSVTRLHFANTAEWIEVLLGVEILADPRNIVLNGSFNFPRVFQAIFDKLLWPLFSMMSAACEVMQFQFCWCATVVGDGINFVLHVVVM